MLITKKILIRNKILSIENISLNSHKLVKVKCDNCGIEKEIKYQSYNKITDNGLNKYYCNSKDCINKKRLLSVQNKYGVDNVSQLEFVQNKKIKKNLEKYGVKFLTQSDDIKNKIKKINQDKYGKNWITQTDEFKIKSIETNLKKYGVKHPSQSDIIKDKIKKTNLEKYGVKHPSQSDIIKDKIKKTNLEKYGVEYTLNLDDIKDKIKKTNLEKYGVEYILNLDDIKDKIKKTNLEKYGVIYPSESNIVKDKIKKTNLEKYGVEHYSQSDIYKGVVKKRQFKNLFNKYSLDIINIDRDKIKMKCNKHGCIFDTTYQLLYNRNIQNKNQCTICNPLNVFSEDENDLKKFINDNYNDVIVLNSRNIIKPYELDIYIPDLKLAFEFNGIYWHNELYKDKNYHLNKTELCEKNGIQLIHIYEDDWIYKQDIVKSMILNKLGKTPNKIYVRKCEIREITDNKLVREFLDKNHIQGFIGSKVKLGLFYENELVSLMIFSKRTSDKGEFDLLRFCNKLNTNVVEGGNKLFKYFVKNYDPKMITTYADRSWSNGNLYKQLGFKYEGKTEPNYYYIIERKKYHRFNFRKDKLIREGYDPELTKHQIMLNRKIYRIFDSGNLKFKY
jgi:hypothetical protein